MPSAAAFATTTNVCPRDHPASTQQCDVLGTEIWQEARPVSAVYMKKARALRTNTATCHRWFWSIWMWAQKGNGNQFAISSWKFYTTAQKVPRSNASTRSPLTTIDQIQLSLTEVKIKTSSRLQWGSKLNLTSSAALSAFTPGSTDPTENGSSAR